MNKIGCKLFKVTAYFETFKQLIFIKLSNTSSYEKSARTGYLRGIDFYAPLNFCSVLANALLNYKKVHGVYPNLVTPQGFSEKVFWFKFFGEVKVPETGNKLLTERFIPEHIRHLISCPQIVWHAKHATLPKNDEIPAGSYYLKASHGSNMFKKIQYPLTDHERVVLELTCHQWLAYSYGIETGEWWYNSFEKEILIEKNITNCPTILSMQKTSVAKSVNHSALCG